MNRDDKVYLKHILDAINQINEYVKDINYESFMAARLVQDGVVRQFEIIGEATKNLSDEFRTRHGDIQWKDMAGMRDKLIHQYFGVDMEAVWESVIEDIPALKKSVTDILKNTPET